MTGIFGVARWRDCTTTKRHQYQDDRKLLTHDSKSSINAASSITLTPKSCALDNLLPAPGPATSTVVLALTDPETFAPSARNLSDASSRVMDSNVPVNTQVCPDKSTPVVGASTARTGQWTPKSRSSWITKIGRA